VIGWLLDTNVVSELSKPRPDPTVADWARAQHRTHLLISVLTIGELLHGIWKLPSDSPTRARFEAGLARIEAAFEGRVLAVSDAVVRRWGQLSGGLRAKGRAAPAIDVLLAATAIDAGLYLATRNVRDVRATGAAVFNPWTDDPARFPLTG